MEINMKNVKKVGLSALAGALAFTSATAGDLSISGSMVGSYTKKGGYNTTANPLGMDKELSITGSGELDNGVGVAYKQTITDAFAFNDSELVFTNVPYAMGGSIALTSTGSPIDAIDDKTPIAFEEANAAVGSVKDVAGVNGTYGLRYTLADVAGTGIKLDTMYVFEHGTGDAADDKGTANDDTGNGEGYDIVLSGSVPGVEGLSFNAGYAHLENDAGKTAGVNNLDQNEGTINVNYAIGAFSVGAQRSVVSQEAKDATMYDTEYLGISYAISDNLSISYNEIDAEKHTPGVMVAQDFDSISLSYTAGGMTLGILDASVDNASYQTGRAQTATALQMTIAF